MNIEAPLPTPESRVLEKVLLETVQVQSQSIFSGHMLQSLRAEAWIHSLQKDNQVQEMMLHIRAKCLAHKMGCPTVTATASVEYPDGVWQGLKDRWFPKWLLKKYPAVLRRKTVVCEETFDVFRAYPDAPELPKNVYGTWGVMAIKMGGRERVNEEVIQ